VLPEVQVRFFHPAFLALPHGMAGLNSPLSLIPGGEYRLPYSVFLPWAKCFQRAVVVAV
jgi:hypothetical protein